MEEQILGSQERPDGEGLGYHSAVASQLSECKDPMEVCLTAKEEPL